MAKKWDPAELSPVDVSVPRFSVIAVVATPNALTSHLFLRPSLRFPKLCVANPGRFLTRSREAAMKTGRGTFSHEVTKAQRGNCSGLNSGPELCEGHEGSVLLNDTP